jgi:hypothetical protein
MSVPDSDFAPVNPTDGRKVGEWESRYTDSAARRAVRVEATYLAILFFGAPVVILALWLEVPKHWLSISDEKYKIFFRYGLAWATGTFGGTLFDIKWLYHSVAKQTWHLDRRLWRIFTPHLSGGLSSAVIALISSGLIRVFDKGAVESPSLVFGVAFLVGYFSDNTIAKLAEVASTLFGPIRSSKEPSDQDHR